MKCLGIRLVFTSQQVDIQSRRLDGFQTKIIKCHARTVSSQRVEKRERKKPPTTLLSLVLLDAPQCSACPWHRHVPLASSE